MSATDPEYKINPDAHTFKVGDWVRFNARHKELFDHFKCHDEEVRQVILVHAVPPKAQKRVGHHQWLALERYEVKDWMISGCLVELAKEEEWKL